MAYNENTKRGIGFIGALQLVFITLKLCNVIDWVWWVVLLPLEIYFALVIVGLLIIAWRNK